MWYVLLIHLLLTPQVIKLQAGNNAHPCPCSCVYRIKITVTQLQRAHKYIVVYRYIHILLTVSKLVHCSGAAHSKLGCGERTIHTLTQHTHYSLSLTQTHSQTHSQTHIHTHSISKVVASICEYIDMICIDNQPHQPGLWAVCSYIRRLL